MLVTVLCEFFLQLMFRLMLSLLMDDIIVGYDFNHPNLNFKGRHSSNAFTTFLILLGHISKLLD
jgi:hypothetical protein